MHAPSGPESAAVACRLLKAIDVAARSGRVEPIKQGQRAQRQQNGRRLLSALPWLS